MSSFLSLLQTYRCRQGIQECSRARFAFEKSPVRLVQLLANVPKAQKIANRKNSPAPGTRERQAHNIANVGTTAEDVTPAAHMTALAAGPAFCIEAFSVCTPKKGRCSKIQRSPGGHPWGFAVPPTV